MALLASVVPMPSQQLHPFFAAQKRKSPALEDPIPDPPILGDVDTHRPKRAKSVESEPTFLNPQDLPSPQEPHAVNVPQQTVQVVISAQPKTLPAAPDQSNKENKEDGKRILKLNGKGTLGSPKLVQNPLVTFSKDALDKDKGESTRGPSPKSIKKPRRSRKSNTPVDIKTLVVHLRYQSKNVAEAISRILSGQSEDTTKTKLQSKSVITKPTPALTPHPFFSNKKRQVETAENKPVPSTSFEPQQTQATKHDTASQRPTFFQSRPPVPTFDIIQQTRSSKPTKNGTREPPWPWKGATRILPDQLHLSDIHAGSEIIPEIARKRKSAALILTSDENILSRQLVDLKQGKNGLLSASSSLNRRSELRLPKKLVTTGRGIQSFLASELSHSSPNSDLTNIHPAIKHIYSSIDSYLAPFDRFHCETQSWVQKYAPGSAEQVLQSGSEPTILLEWLANHRINNVDSGKIRQASTESSKKVEKPKKRRKRRDDLEGFIASETDDENDFGELTDVEDESNKDRKAGKRSIVRRTSKAHKRTGKTPMANVVLLSGPNGSGKSAAVYAVAQELGFQVFEINAGMRRSQKDILDRIGDMAENHLVQLVSKTVADAAKKPANDSTNLEPPESPNTKNASMDSFFKPVASKKPSTQGSKASPSKGASTKSSGKEQKQSLILFEEVDVLFKEDKQFWATVVALAAHSKRPIVITCNDEPKVLSNVTLHAILRFEPPPVALATDYLITLAAKEGHRLNKAAVSRLYESTGSDLRASITTLDFWCQMAIGDEKGGLSWLINRWPIGSDLDEYGRTLRVVSEGTYAPGLEWANSKSTVAGCPLSFDVEDQLYVAIKDGELSLEQLAMDKKLLSSTLWNDGQGTLDDFVSMSEILSSADVYCRLGIRSGREVCCFTTTILQF